MNTPMLAFSIDALAEAGDRAWRLLADRRHWRKARFGEPLRSEDAMLSLAEAEPWHGRRLVRDKRFGLAPREKPGRFSFWPRGAFAHAIVHRFQPAPIPARKALQRCIAALAPGTPWLVFLDLGGNYRALDTTKENIIGNLKIAVRGEIASSPGYIGEEAAKNEAAIAQLHRQFLAGWLAHLTTGQTGRFIPEAEQTPEEEALIAQISAWKPEPLPEVLR